MKIVIIGTSNSIIGRNGYLRSLSMFHEVETYLMGRVSFLFHMQVLHENRERFEKADLIIIDHYINDLNFYYPFFGSAYLPLLEIFYQYLSTFNVHVLNLLFPVRNLKEEEGFSLYESISSLSRAHGVSLLDLNQVGFRSDEYQDDVHISISASYAFGLALASALTRQTLPKRPGGGAVDTMPLEFLSVDQIVHPNLLEYFSNSIFSRLPYLPLRAELTIERNSDAQLIAIGYFRPKDAVDPSGVVINQSDPRGFFGNGIFIEMLDEPVSGVVTMCPIVGRHESVVNLMRRESSSGSFSVPALTSFIFFHQRRKLDVVTASREFFEIKLTVLTELLDRISDTRRAAQHNLPVLRVKTVEFLRDAALEHEKSNFALAKDLMHLAHLARPTGPQIARKFKQYSEQAQRILKKSKGAM